MASAFGIRFDTTLKDTAIPKLRASINKLTQAHRNATSKMVGEIGKVEGRYDRLNKVVKNVSATINKQFGGRIKNGAGDLNNFGQNLSSISNRLGFMAFQWNFMANAANRAVDIVVGGLARIITEGAKTSDALGRALAFGTSVNDLRNQTGKAVADLQILRDAIFNEGSGKSIFGVAEISDISKEIAKASPDSVNAQDIANIIPFASKLKAIEPTLSNEKIGTGLISLFRALGTDVSNIEEVSAAMDFLSNVSDKSTATFGSSIGSLGVAAGKAKAIGIDAFELGLIIQRVADINARNKAGGRAASTPGNFANAFFEDIQRFTDDKTFQGKAAIALELDIFDQNKDGRRIFKDLVGITEGFKKQLAGLTDAERAERLSKLGLSENSQSVVLDLLDEQGQSIEDQLESIKERGTLEARFAASTANAQSSILRIQNAIEASKAVIAEGFGRTLKLIADGLSEITSNSEFRTMLGDIGIILGNQVIPHLKLAFKFAKIFIGFLINNKKTLRFVIAAVVALSAALAGLAIIATIGFFALVAGSSLFGMAGQMTIAGGAAATLSAGMSLLLRKLIPIMIVGLGIALVGLALTGAFDDSLTPAVIALGLAIAALGAIALFPGPALGLIASGATTLLTKLGLLKPAVTAATSSVSAFDQYLKARAPFEIFGTGGTSNPKSPVPFQLGQTGGKEYMKGLTGAIAGPNGITSKIMKGFQSLGKAGPIGAVVAVAAVVILSFINAMENKVENSAIFKMKLVDKWQQVGSRMTAATNVFMRNIVKGFFDGLKWITDALNATAIFANDVLTSAWNATKAFLSSGSLEQAAAELQKGLDKAFAKFDFDDTFNAFFDGSGVIGAAKEIKNSLGALENAGFGRFDPVVIETLADILDQWQISSVDILGDEIQGAINSVFGSDFVQIFAPISEAANTAATEATGMGTEMANTSGALTQTQIELAENQKILAEMGENYGIVSDSVEEVSVAQLASAAALTGYVTLVAANSVEVTNVTNTVITEIATLLKKIDLEKLLIVEIANQINAMILSTGFVLQVNVMWAKLIAEGNRAAGKLASLKLNKTTGKFSIKDPGISGFDRSIIDNAQNVRDNFVSQAKIIDIDALKSELAQLTVILTTATAGNTGSSPTETAAAAATAASDAAMVAADLGVPEPGNIMGLSPEGAAVFQRYLDYLNQTNGIKSFNTPGAYTISGAGGTVLAAAGANGSTNIDINIDGTFDINVSQGGLTTEQILDLEKQIGGALLNQVKEKLGVQQ